ncbi:MAG: RNA polymerase sigma factor [Oscillospiraceae bacterium]|nr:RNA polymerase sigma factor [Oscillospiraceae bacterium]
MAKSLLRTDRELADIYGRHKATVYRVCFAYMKNTADTEDAVQETFFRLIKSGPAFGSEEHEKAWLIRTASNLCKNVLRSWWRRRENLDDHQNLRGSGPAETDEVLSAVMGLPEPYKTAVYLYYYEGYDSAEISKILGKPKSTVRNHLHEARGVLRKKLGGDLNEK